MNEKKVSLMEFESNPNIGIYMFANDKFCLIGPEISENKQKEIEKTLGVPAYKVSILGTELVGVFASGNNEFLIVPPMYENEQKNLEEITNKHGTKLVIMSDIQNTFGNNLCLGNDKILINPNYSKQFENALVKKIGKEIKIIKIKHKDFNSVGSTCIFINGKFFISQEYSEEDVKEILDDLAGLGTVNAGSNYVSSGIVGNKFGIILGSISSTVEIQNIIEDLDYL